MESVDVEIEETSGTVVQNGTSPHEAAESSASKVLSRDDIFAQGFKAQIVEVEIPEWGGSVFVRELTGKERDSFELSQLEGRGNNKRLNLNNMRAKLVAFSTVGADGKRMFNEKDAAELGNLSSKALTRIYKVASDLSGLTPEDEEELTQELGETPSAGSGTT